MSPIHPDIPSHFHACEKRHQRVYWEHGNLCPVCDAMEEIIRVERNAAEDIREAERGGRRW